MLAVHELYIERGVFSLVVKRSVGFPTITEKLCNLDLNYLSLVVVNQSIKSHNATLCCHKGVSK